MDIENYNVYNARMAKTLMDKIWWLDKISDDIDTIVDFGCANAVIMGLIESIQPHRFQYIGIDCNKTMISYAMINVPNGRFYFNIKDMIINEKNSSNHAVFLLNSVIHEIKTYCPEKEQNELKRSILFFNPKFIAIRDMHMITETKEPFYNENTVYNYISGSKYIEMWIDYLNNSKSNIHIDWVNTVTEFLLKHTYKENWEREKNETYLWNWSKECGNKYHKVYEISFNIPFLVNQIKEDFNGLNWNEINTHKKVLLERR